MTIEEKKNELQQAQANLQQQIQHHARQRDAVAQRIGELSAQLLRVEGGLAALDGLTAEPPNRPHRKGRRTVQERKQWPGTNANGIATSGTGPMRRRISARG